MPECRGRAWFRRRLAPESLVHTTRTFAYHKAKASCMRVPTTTGAPSHDGRSSIVNTSIQRSVLQCTLNRSRNLCTSTVKVRSILEARLFRQSLSVAHSQLETIRHMLEHRLYSLICAKGEGSRHLDYWKVCRQTLIITTIRASTIDRVQDMTLQIRRP